jgi:addiction module HigA family antidote
MHPIVSSKLHPTTHLNMAPKKQRLVHPGEVLVREFMKPFALSSYKLAKVLKVSIPTVNEIVRKRRAVTPGMALRLSRYFGTTPQQWLTLQAEYDLALARRKTGKSIAKSIRPLSRRKVRGRGATIDLSTS